uniref:Uncharacterized protein n=1 Tax=Chenopodium quinoa TaxID=63459 RepID=A0A803M621_CHEQI
MWEKLHNSLLLRAKEGKVYVNCNGACYIVVYQTNWSNIVTNNFYRPINNVIFDWSQFGVTVPNSVNDSLRKQLQQKDQDVTMMSTLLCSVKGEASACRMQQQDTEMELQKVRNQLCVKEFDLNATKTKLELSKEEVKELQDQVSTSNKKDYQNLEMNCKSKKEYEEMKVKVQSMQDQVYKAVADLQSQRLTKSRLETSHKKIFELEEQLSSGGKVQEQLCLIMKELQSIKVLADFTAEKEVDVEDQCVCR